MPDTETDIGFMDETLTDFEYAETEEKNEVEDSNTYEVEERAPASTPSAPESNPTIAAILDERGGRVEDWQFVDRGDAGYRFDGENVCDPEGNIWINPDSALHEAMLQEWHEGEGGIFLLPDYTERTEDKETLYITTLHLDGASGSVSWEIHAHETLISKEEESGTRVGNDKQIESFSVRSEEIADEVEEEHEAPETVLGVLAAAEKAEEENEMNEVSDVDDEEFEHNANGTQRDVQLRVLLHGILNGEPLDTVSPEDDGEKDVVAKADEAVVPQREHPIVEKETPAEVVLRALGIPLPTQKRSAFRAKVPGFRPATGKKIPLKQEAAPAITKTRPGETKLNGIRMRKAL